MKKLVLIFFAGILLTSISYAQTRGGLTGPKAKNYKSWQDNAEKSTAVHQVSKKQLTGPQAKNKHLRKSQGSAEYAAISSSSQPRLTGPKAKNQKFWQAQQAARRNNMDTVTDDPAREEKNNQNEEGDNDNR